MSSRNISWDLQAAGVWLTTLQPECADCLEILVAPHSVSLGGSSSSVQWLLYVFVRNEDVKNLTRARKKIGHMKSVEKIDFYKWAKLRTSFVKKKAEEFNYSAWIIVKDKPSRLN